MSQLFYTTLIIIIIIIIIINYYYYYYSDLFLPTLCRSRGYWCTWSRSVTNIQTHTQYYSVRMISPTQRPIPDNTQHPQKKDIHASCKIRTLNPSKQAAADPRLRTLGHRHHFRPQMQNWILYPLNWVTQIEDLETTIKPYSYLTHCALTHTHTHARARAYWLNALTANKFNVTF